MSKRESIEAKREYNRKRYYRDREKILAQQKERYGRDRDKILSKDQEYYQRNKEVIRARAAAHYKVNAETVKARERNRRLERKLAAMAVIGGKCLRCAERHPAAIDFHHRSREDKLFSIGDMMMNRKQVDDETFEAEVRKCDLLCKNCHAKEHSQWELDG